jgi:hypothetical protein
MVGRSERGAGSQQQVPGATPAIDGGFVLIYRRLLEDPDFATAAEALAFAYLIIRAAWRPCVVRYKGHRVELGRGQLAISIRDMAEDLEWSKSRCDRFISGLKKRDKIGTECGAGVTVITVCKYSDYQFDLVRVGTPVEQEPGHQRDTSGTQNKEGKEGKEGKVAGAADAANTDYAFAGQTVRLTPEHFNDWRATFHAIADLEAELSSLDAWFQTPAGAPKRGSWFFTSKGALNRKHQELLAASRTRQPTLIPGGTTQIGSPC